MNILAELFFALWFFLPAGLANMVPILAAKMPGLRHLNAPIDGGRTYKNQRILGAHKTWRGLIVGIVIATITLWAQQYAIGQSTWLYELTNQVNYADLMIWVVGPLFGLGALGGDAIESFFKRQRQVAPGHGWFPFDQIDYIVGGAIATAPFVRLQLWQYIELLVLWLIVHVIASYVGYLLHFKDKPI